GIPGTNPTTGKAYPRSQDMVTALQDLKVTLVALDDAAEPKLTNASLRSLEALKSGTDACIPPTFKPMLAAFSKLNLRSGGGVIDRKDLMQTLDAVFEDEYETNAKAALKI